MSETVTLTKEEIDRLQERVRKLGGEKSYLQLLNHLMSSVSAIPGIENTAGAIVRLIIDNIGGSNVALYYLVGAKIHYVDALGEKKILETVADDMVRTAMEQRDFVEETHSFSDTKMLIPELAHSCHSSDSALPLMVGDKLIGVLKLEGMLLAAAEIRHQFALFFNYAALILKNEIESYAKLMDAYTQLSRVHDELKREGDERFRQQQVLEALLESIEAGIVACDANGVLTMFNRKSRELHGLPAEALPAEEWAGRYDLFMPDGKTRMRKEDIALFRALQGKSVSNEEMVVIPRDREPRHLLVSGKIIHGKDGQSVGAVVAMHDVTDQKRMQREVEKIHSELLMASRQAGMAEVATGVLHNVGNVLNSVNISTTLVIEGLQESQIINVGRLGELLTKNADDLAAFFTKDPTGTQLPGYVNRLAGRLTQERDILLKECGLIRTNIDHIKDIVSMQQNYAKGFGVVEKVRMADLIEDSLRLDASALSRHGLEVIRDIGEPGCEITVEKHKVLQILVNLIRNAKHACDESGRSEKQLTVRSRIVQDRVKIEVMDNGVGIPPENMIRLFNHGFTTRKTGHGFGLHSAANAAKEMGGSLVAHSDGVQRGATFTLELPLLPPNQSP